MSLSICRPITTSYGSSSCFKIRHNGKEISVACDDSCGKLPDFTRSDIRLYDKDSKDVTYVTFPEDDYGSVVYGTFENLQVAMKWLES